MLDSALVLMIFGLFFLAVVVWDEYRERARTPDWDEYEVLYSEPTPREIEEVTRLGKAGGFQVRGNRSAASRHFANARHPEVLILRRGQKVNELTGST